MQLSIVVPTYNRREVALQTLATLITQDFPKDEFEVLVVVDGSTDGTAEAVRRLRPGCKLEVIEQPNAGLAAARNAGLQHASGEFVLFLDDDIRGETGLARAHVTAHRAAELPVLVIGAVFLTDDSPRSTASDCFEAEIGSFYLAHRANPSLAFPSRAWVFMNTSVRRDVLLKAGGFDPTFRMQREDQDLGFRLGPPIVYASNAIGREYYNKTGWDLLRDAREFARGDVLLVQQHPALWPDSAVQNAVSPRGWTGWFRAFAARVYVFDPLLALVWFGAGTLRRWPFFRYIGMRTLQAHRMVVWTRAVRKWRMKLQTAEPQYSSTGLEKTIH